GDGPVAMDEMTVMIPVRVLHLRPDAGKGRGDRLRALDARAVDFRAADGEEHAIVSKPAHDAVNVVLVEGIEQARQIPWPGNSVAHAAISRMWRPGDPDRRSRSAATLLVPCFGDRSASGKPL